MPLTPSDIEQKTFATSFKGYDLAEVDDFLDEIIGTIRDLEEKAARGGSGDAPVTAPVIDESAVGRALIAAQTAADRILEEAREEAERIKSEARIEADSWESDRASKQAEAEAAISALSERVDSVRRELAALVNTLADGIDEMESTIEEAEAFVAGESVETVDTGEGSDDPDDSGDSDDNPEAEVFESWQLGQAVDQAT